MPSAATQELITELDRAGPFGASAPAPRFAFPDVQLNHARVVGSGHLKITINDGMGARLDGILFNAMDGPLGQTLLEAQGTRLHLAGRLEPNTWQGRTSVQIKVDDAAKVAG